MFYVSARIVWVRGPGADDNCVTSSRQTPPRPGQTKYFIIHGQGGGQTILNFNVNAETIVLSGHNAGTSDWLSTFNSFVEFITFFSGTNYDNNEQNSYGGRRLWRYLEDALIFLWNIRIQTRHDLTSGRLIKTLGSKSVETYFILQLRACTPLSCHRHRRIIIIKTILCIGNWSGFGRKILA